jgi:hypothetical protein
LNNFNEGVVCRTVKEFYITDRHRISPNKMHTKLKETVDSKGSIKSNSSYLAFSLERILMEHHNGITQINSYFDAVNTGTKAGAWCT